MTFANFPPGCPPIEAEACTGEIFRLVPTLPIDQSGFISQFELYPGNDWKDKECLAHGLSVGRSYEAMSKLRKRIKGMRTFKIAFASLQAAIGVIQQTGGPEHYTWWPGDGSDIVPLFAAHASETI